MSYKKLYSECGYSQNALTSAKHFLLPNNPNYYLKKYYEPISNISHRHFQVPHELKFGNNITDNPFEHKHSSYRFEKDKKCNSCGLKEYFRKIPMHKISI